MNVTNHIHPSPEQAKAFFGGEEDGHSWPGWPSSSISGLSLWVKAVELVF